MRILGVDPSLRSTGYGLIDVDAERHGAKPVTVDFGTIKCKSQMLQSGCLLRIREELTDLIEQYQPDAMAVEGIIFVHSHQIAINLGAARGACILAGAQAGLEIFEYAPRKVKQSVVGKGAAQKQQVGFMVRVLLGLRETPQADAADALAIALTHAQNLQLQGLNQSTRI